MHRDARSLVESAGLYVAAGLERGGGVLVIAPPAHTEAILVYLHETGLDVDAMRRAGEFVVLDAEAILARILRGGKPVWSEFRRIVGPLVDHLLRYGRGHCRVYGETVNVLWLRGKYSAAIQLEEYWDALAKSHEFSMFCSYELDSHDHRCYHEPLADIGRTHSEIITGDDDEAFRDALDRASEDVFGAPLSATLTAAPEHAPGEHRLPTAQRTMLWIERTLPASSADLLNRARAYLHELTPALEGRT
jgi:hypothetical protein